MKKQFDENEIFKIERTTSKGDKRYEEGTFIELFEMYKYIIDYTNFNKYCLEKFSKEHGNKYEVPQDELKASESIHNIKELIKAVNLSYKYEHLLEMWNRKEYGPSKDRWGCSKRANKRQSIKLVK